MTADETVEAASFGIARLRSTSLHHTAEAPTATRRARSNVRTGSTLMTAAKVRLTVALRVV